MGVQLIPSDLRLAVPQLLAHRRRTYFQVVDQLQPEFPILADLQIHGNIHDDNGLLGELPDVVSYLQDYPLNFPGNSFSS